GLAADDGGEAHRRDGLDRPGAGADQVGERHQFAPAHHLRELSAHLRSVPESAFPYHMVSRKEWDALAKDFEREVCDITRETGSDAIARMVTRLKPSPEKSVLVDLG